MDYLNRCQTLLQEGLFVADLAYFTGDNVVGYTKVHRNELNPVPPEGYDYDLMNTETLLNRAWIEQGRLRLPDGMSYRILVLQEQSYITLGLLRKLREMVEQGLVMLVPVLIRLWDCSLILLQRKKNSNSFVMNYGERIWLQ